MHDFMQCFNSILQLPLLCFELGDHQLEGLYVIYSLRQDVPFLNFGFWRGATIFSTLKILNADDLTANGWDALAKFDNFEVQIGAISPLHGSVSSLPSLGISRICRVTIFYSFLGIRF